MFNDIQYRNLRTGGKILHDVLEMLKDKIDVGVSTLELDAWAEKFIRERGGVPAFLNHDGFLHTLCVSVNDEIIHGIPSNRRILKNGDVVSVDCGVRYPAADNNNSMCTDAARTFIIGEGTEETRELVHITEQCFREGIKNLRAGDEVASIGKRIEKFVNGRYGIIDTYYGHGIGSSVHEDPLIPLYDVDKETVNKNIAKAAHRPLKKGAVICIEPMIVIGDKSVRILKDGWTVVTRSGEIAAHFENTVIVGDNGVEIIT